MKILEGSRYDFSTINCFYKMWLKVNKILLRSGFNGVSTRTAISFIVNIICCLKAGCNTEVETEIRAVAQGDYVFNQPELQNRSFDHFPLCAESNFM